MAHFHVEHSCCGHHHHELHASEGRGNEEQSRSKAGRSILVAFVLNLSFALIELIGGWLTGSIAVLSDALHDFGDCLSLGLAWYLERLSTRGRDSFFSYGYKRFSLLSALIISLVLILGSCYMIYTALGRLVAPEPVKAAWVCALAILGVAVNAYAAWRMLGDSSLSNKALRLHLIEDVLGWAAILVVSIVMYFVELPILDPILSILISLWILYNAGGNISDTLRILLQAVPQDVDCSSFETDLRQIEHIKDVHDLHVWTMNGHEHIASLHIVHDCTLLDNAKAITQFKHSIREIGLKHGIQHLTIELDPEGESCGMECC